jgi:hypothetical protein
MAGCALSKKKEEDLKKKEKNMFLRHNLLLNIKDEDI